MPGAASMSVRVITHPSSLDHDTGRGHPESPARITAIVEELRGDKYRGAVPFVRVVDGTLHSGQRIGFGAGVSEYEVDEVGFMQLGYQPTGSLKTGEVGGFICLVEEMTGGVIVKKT